jgi:hippurate hydrolase
VEAVYGMHNWPGVPVGEFAVRPGPIMAADDKWEVTITSRGAHAAMPHLGDDPIVAAGAMIGAIQTIASRTVDPQDEVVVSVTQVHGGNTWNIVPRRSCCAAPAAISSRRCARCSRRRCFRVSQGVAATHGVNAAFAYYKPIPPAVNAAGPTELAARAASLVAGEAKVHRDLLPSMGCEDFGFMLAGTARLLHLDRQRADGRRPLAAQRALRFQRRHPAARRELLVDPGGEHPAARVRRPSAPRR